MAILKLAVNDPSQLPYAILNLVQYEVMAAVVNSLWCEIAGMLEEWEGLLSEVVEESKPWP